MAKRKFARERIPTRNFQAEFPVVPYDVEALYQEIRRTHFPDLTIEATWQFSWNDTLASIVSWRNNRKSAILLHSILNHKETPEQVIRHILIHELLHLVVPPREIDGEIEAHPPEFWERERELSPNSRDCMSWVMINFMFCLKVDRKAQCIWVKPRLANKRRTTGYLPFEWVTTMGAEEAKKLPEVMSLI